MHHPHNPQNSDIFSQKFFLSESKVKHIMVLAYHHQTIMTGNRFPCGINVTAVYYCDFRRKLYKTMYFVQGWAIHFVWQYMHKCGEDCIQFFEQVLMGSVISCSIQLRVHKILAYFPSWHSHGMDIIFIPIVYYYIVKYYLYYRYQWMI